MNKRLVWNFEIPYNGSLTLPQKTDSTSDIRWEFRLFWPETKIILLNCLEHSFLDLSRYKIKHRTDRYYLLAGKDYNIKKRSEDLVYKPLVTRLPSAIGYGKKEKEGYDNLLQEAKDQGRIVDVDKEALIYKFEAYPATKLELARLVVNQEVFFTCCVEAPELAWVEQISRQLTSETHSSDYVSFLKKLVGLP